MLTKSQKREIIEKLAEDIKNSKSVVFVDFKGLKVNDTRALKKDLRNSGASLKVAKKTLINLALEKAGVKIDARLMEGQIALAVSDADETSPAKIIDGFSKKNKNIKILAGLLGSKIMKLEEIEALAKLPSKEELLAKLVGTLNAPISGFVNVLAGNLRGLVQALNAMAEKK
ncbi:MAG: 50S ribosomal protein L10 [Candidatus Moranbacteria bacterium RIFCSPHIGHO2_02_FULL_40_12b]|nr:MAG: 50S ribosomal protein L10 [Candidatus Moranbacteria bacterium RIFCSPHIGHO2_02_FULL_40_12b]OGI24316.1 MAG: 50S ribosomal protein L10 [Candidatus Moranbacteria bacterium RIFCSPHIGHO2_12_FULL_40_10]